MKKKTLFSLSPVEFRDSPIAGRGVFTKRRFQPGDRVVDFAPKQRRLPISDPEAEEASATKVTLLSEGTHVIIPDTSVPGGWLCNHSCDPNAAIFSSGPGRVECTRSIAPGEEISVFYGWVTRNQPARDPCACGSVKCRGFINFDVSDADANAVEIVDDNIVPTDERLHRRLAEYAKYLRSIGQAQVQVTIADTFAEMKRRIRVGSVG